MAYEIKWSPEAAEDLESISDYISKDSAYYASSVVSKIVLMARDLPNNPKSGRIVPEVGDENVREKLVYSYRLIYEIYEETIMILAIIHGRRLLENIAERFDG